MNDLLKQVQEALVGTKEVREWRPGWGQDKPTDVMLDRVLDNQSLILSVLKALLEGTQREGGK